jgi:hypothetical protein
MFDLAKLRRAFLMILQEDNGRQCLSNLPNLRILSLDIFRGIVL